MTMPALYTIEDISSYAQAAADIVINEIGLPETGARDCVNLVVNVMLGMISDWSDAEQFDLDAFIAENYGSSPSEVREWCAS